MIPDLITPKPGLINPGHLITILAILAVVSLTFACGESESETDSVDGSDPISVVTTTGLLADLVRNVGGDLVAVESLVPPGADAHSFQSTPENSVAISKADVVVSNGGGLDQFLDSVIDGALSKDAVHIIAAATLVASEEGETPTEDANHEGEDADHHAGEGDPHFWQNPLYTVEYTETIMEGLIQADPENQASYRSNFDSYKEQLIKLDFDIASTLNVVDEDKRKLVTFHDAFGHFAERYGWEAVSFVASDASQVTPNAIADVLERVREEGIPAVFAEPQFSSELLDNAAKVSGAEIGIIYPDLPGGGVDSYINMMLFNAKSLARLLE
ncbi:MAG TPA: hypothetical protein DIT90_00845 [Dehalococcoidia bacterium]|nr:hypothetical protein [Dehalococcoidia bacterium]